MTQRALYSVWKDGNGWKVQCPNGRLTFSTKKLAEDVAAVARVAALNQTAACNVEAALRQAEADGSPDVRAARVTPQQQNAGRIWQLETLVSTLADYLAEAHQPDLDENHGGDDLTACPCSYCDAIAEARQLVKDEYLHPVQVPYLDVPEPHTTDADCHHLTGGCCDQCGVFHGDPCPECQQRAFHADGCPLSDATPREA